MLLVECVFYCSAVSGREEAEVKFVFERRKQETRRVCDTEYNDQILLRFA